MALSLKIIGLPQAALRTYGRFVGRHPLPVFFSSFLFCALLCLGWLHIGEGGKNAFTTLEFEEQWTVAGSELEGQIRHIHNDWKRKNKDPWYQEYHYAMVVGKGDHRGADILTREMLLESFTLYAKFFEIEVTTQNGKTYDTWDLCARGAVPDNPAFPFKLPCKIVDPLNCFREYSAFLDPLYLQYIDGSGAPGILSYLGRPALSNLSDTEIKSTLSLGCKWFVDSATWEVPMWSGSREWNGNQLTRAEGLGWTMYLDGPRRIALRMNLTKPHLAVESDIEEALGLHSKVWTQMVQDFSQDSQLLEAAILQTNFLEDLEEKLEEPEWHLIVAGGVLMNLFVSFSMASWTAPLASRCSLGQEGLGVVCFATMAAGGFFFLLGFKLNSAIMGGIPFLAMGLGVNDMLVLSRSFSELGVPFLREHSTSEIIGEVTANAGVGVSLTSLCNVMAFSLASITLPVHGLSDFCLCAAIDSALNYFAMMTLFLCCLCKEAHRVQRGKADPAACTWFCHAWLRRHSQESCGPESFVEEKFVACLRTRVAPRFASLPAGLIFAFVTCLALGLSVVPIVGKTIGYNPEEIAPTNSPSHRALELIFDNFNFFPARLVYRDLDVAASQAQMLLLYADLTNTSRTRFTMPHLLPPYLTMFYNFVAGAFEAGALGNSTPFEAGAFAGTPAGQLYAPYGSVAPAAFQGIYKAWSAMPLDDHSQALAPGGDAYKWADMVFTNEFNYHQDGRIQFSFNMFFLINTKSDEDFITLIETTNDIVDASPLRGHAFVYSDIHTYWSTFIGIDAVLWKALAITVSVMFVSTLLLLQSPASALIVAAMSLMIVLNMYGICMMLLKFNSFVVSSVLAGAGISIEFTAHIASSFVLAEGSPERRLAHMMKETYPAIIQGSVSTVLGLLPLIFSHIPFIRQYIFMPFAILVLVGMFDGMVLLPGLLALSARLCSRKENTMTLSQREQGAEDHKPANIPTILQSSGLQDETIKI